MDKLEAIIEKLDGLREEVLSIKESKSNKEEWYETKGKLEIKDPDSDKRYLILESNQDTWYDSKEVNNPLYIELHNYDKDYWMNMTLIEMVQLRDYLTHKIDYLNKKD